MVAKESGATACEKLDARAPGGFLQFLIEGGEFRAVADRHFKIGGVICRKAVARERSPAKGRNAGFFGWTKTLAPLPNQQGICYFQAPYGGHNQLVSFEGNQNPVRIVAAFVREAPR